MIRLGRSTLLIWVLILLFSSALTAYACTSEGTTSQEIAPTNTPIPLWQTVVNATLVPTVTPSPTPDLPSPTPTSTPDSAAPPTTTPTVTPSPSPTPEPLTHREAYCRAYALPTSTPEADESPTPVPTPPPGIADDQIPEEWTLKMDAIEAWVREFYEVDEASVGDFNRRFVSDEVWKDWRAAVVEEWSSDEDSTIHLWEQINRTLTLLPADSDYVEFISDYQGESYIGLYNPITREIVVRSTNDKFSLESELVYVHEFAHHIQNEKYEMTAWRDCLKDDGDASGAYRALFEGDASATEYAYIEEVIGWDRLMSYFEGLPQEDADASEEEIAMKRYLDEVNNFTYSASLVFVWVVGDFLGCLNCSTVRQRIDAAFNSPPFATEQIYDVQKYFDKEERDEISLPDDFLGTEWDLRYASTIGKSDWVAFLAALTGREGDEIHTELPEWRGDYDMLFEDGDGRALYVQLARWSGEGYIDRLAGVFDGRPRLTRREAGEGSGYAGFDDYFVWQGDTGYIAMGVEFDSVWRVYTMFLGVGPDLASVEMAVDAARENLEADLGYETFP